MEVKKRFSQTLLVKARQVLLILTNKEELLVDNTKMHQNFS